MVLTNIIENTLIILFEELEEQKKIEDEKELFEEFKKTQCKKLTRISSEGCKYHPDCNVATCLVKYILENYKVYEEVEDE
mgnify:CR=1 FL=1